jgi:hypothetical protein
MIGMSVWCLIGAMDHCLLSFEFVRNSQGRLCSNYETIASLKNDNLGVRSVPALSVVNAIGFPTEVPPHSESLLPHGSSLRLVVCTPCHHAVAISFATRCPPSHGFRYGSVPTIPAFSPAVGVSLLSLPLRWFAILPSAAEHSPQSQGSPFSGDRCRLHPETLRGLTHYWLAPVLGSWPIIPGPLIDDLIRDAGAEMITPLQRSQRPEYPEENAIMRLQNIQTQLKVREDGTPPMQNEHDRTKTI